MARAVIISAVPPLMVKTAAKTYADQINSDLLAFLSEQRIGVGA